VDNSDNSQPNVDNFPCRILVRIIGSKKTDKSLSTKGIYPEGRQ
jgi:hypothetical protein